LHGCLAASPSWWEFFCFQRRSRNHNVRMIPLVKTRHGRIRIEINDPTATVTVDGERVQSGGRDEMLTLLPGPHALVVQRNGRVVQTQDFTITRGDNPVLKITLPPSERKWTRKATPELSDRGRL
jgi:hypothetical protein